MLRSEEERGEGVHVTSFEACSLIPCGSDSLQILTRNVVVARWPYWIKDEERNWLKTPTSNWVYNIDASSLSRTRDGHRMLYKK
jgi:hypothetical protein